MKKDRTYTRAFKVQVCEMVLKDGLKVKSEAERMGISHIMLYRWIDDYKTYGDAALYGEKDKAAC